MVVDEEGSKHVLHIDHNLLHCGRPSLLSWHTCMYEHNACIVTLNTYKHTVTLKQHVMQLTVAKCTISLIK